MTGVYLSATAAVLFYLYFCYYPWFEIFVRMPFGYENQVGRILLYLYLAGQQE